MIVQLVNFTTKTFAQLLILNLFDQITDSRHGNILAD